ncbi:MAG: transcriptional regulator [Nitrospiraceae bacterium]|nr:MAG: transcriptional regulator [Nitrospiraceae bacterium]
MNYFNQIATLVRKDLASELRTKEMLSSMLIFAMLTTVVFSFAFDPDTETVKKVFPGIIWVAFIFAGIMGLNRSFGGERNNDCILGLMLCTQDRGVIYLGKTISNLVFMYIMEGITLPILFVLFDYRLKGSLLLLITVVLLGTWGFIAVGTFMSAMAVNTRNSEILLPIVLFPLIVPVLIAAVQATGIIVNGGNWADTVNWFRVIGAFDVIFTIVPWLLFEYLLEV